MTLADDLLPVAHTARGIAGSLGFRPHTASLLICYDDGPQPGETPLGDELVPLTEGGGFPPRVRQMKTDEIALGNFPPGSLEVGAITPEFAGGGISDERLFGPWPVNTRIYIVITGPLAPNGAKYEIVGSKRDKPLRRVLIVANPTPYP